jgi:hypothetical protein
MDGRIGQLNYRCRVNGAPASTGALQARLARVAREQVTQAYAAALEHALGDDPAVYVLRRVNARLALMLSADTADHRVAQRMGERMAGAIVRSIAREPEGENLVRFNDQADYVAHFIIDLLADQAWHHWFYGAFRVLRQMDTAEVIHTVLEDNISCLPAILANLHRYQALEKVFNSLDRNERQWLWARARGEPHLDRAGIDSLLSVAIRLVERLDLWRGPQPDHEQLLDAFLATRPSYVDWRDERGPADAILDMLRFFNRRGYLNFPPHVDEAFRARLAGTILDFDWINRESFLSELLILCRPPLASQADLPLPSRWRMPTPRQRKILNDLRDQLQLHQIGLDPGDPDSVENALRLYAVLLTKDPGWADDSLAVEIIQRLLEVWKLVRQSVSPGEVLRRLAQGDVQGALLKLSTPAEHSQPGFEFIASLGESGTSVLRELELASGALSDGLGQIIETAHAGVALLLRALLDARFPTLVKGAGYDERPGLAAILLTLFLHYTGPDAGRDGQIDAGLQLLAGLVPRGAVSGAIQTLDQLRAEWLGVAAPDEWQAEWLRLLVAQRMFQPAVMHLYRIEFQGRAAMIAGDESGNLWLFSRLIQSPQTDALVAGRWLELWIQESGGSPLIVADHGTLDVDQIAGQAIRTPAEAGDELASAHAAGRERLLSALGALAGGTCGIPAWDLALALSANVLLRMWARWLRQFGASSVPYLLTQFIHRHGRIYQDGENTTVEMDPRPLDLVLDLAGYRAPLNRVPWLGERRVQFQMRGMP